MPITPPPPSNTISTTAIDLVTDALQEINAIGIGETPSAEDGAKGIRLLQRLIDSMNARDMYVFNYDILTFTLIPNHAPHTIGPAGDWVVNQRPVFIKDANLDLPNTGSGFVRVPIAIRDDKWWMSEVRIPQLTSTFPTNLYYSPSWPLGQLNFWPVSTSAYNVELEVWNVITQVAANGQIISLPPGYWDFIVYTLAVKMLPAYEKPPNPALVELARRAAVAIISNNIGAPRLFTQQAGMPSSKSGIRPDFSFLTGEPW